MTGGSRKSHSKSRIGCRECKRRRIKCDAVGPVCGNCQKRKILCEYADLPMLPMHMEGQGSAAAPAGFASSLPPIPPPQQLFSHPPQTEHLEHLDLLPESLRDVAANSQELELLHHWAISAAREPGIVQNIEAVRSWQLVAIQHAPTNGFLFHALLAFSSAHLAHQQRSSRSRYIKLTQQYHGMALTEFRAVSAITDTKSGPSLAFSILTVLTSLALSGPLREDEDKDDIGNFTQWIIFLRKSIQFAQSYRESIITDRQAAGILCPVLGAVLPCVEPNQGILDALDNLNSINMTSHDTDGTKAVLADAILRTRRIFNYIPDKPNAVIYTIIWSISATDEFFELMQNRNQVALALMATSLIPVLDGPKRWFFDDLPTNVILSVSNVLDDECRASIGWVFEYVHTHKQVDGGPGHQDSVLPCLEIGSFLNGNYSVNQSQAPSNMSQVSAGGC